METRSTIRVKFNFAKRIIEIVVNFSNFETFAQHGDPHWPRRNKQLTKPSRLNWRVIHAILAGDVENLKSNSRLVRIHRIVQAGKSLDAATISDIIPISIIDKWNNVGQKPETVTGDSKYRWNLPLCEPSAGFSYKLRPRGEEAGSIARDLGDFEQCLVVSFFFSII